MDIARIFCFDKEEHYWVLHNTADDRIAQMATVFGKDEIECYKELVGSGESRDL